MDLADAKSCPLVGFSISGVEHLSSATREVVCVDPQDIKKIFYVKVVRPLVMLYLT
jgi:hypothetical protein